MGIIGSLLYLTASRPDIVFGVRLCARFQSNSKESHLKVAKRILRYFKGTQNLQNFEYFGVYIDGVPLLCVNTSALNMAKNPVLHKKTKHIDVRHHFLRDNVKKGLICIRFCCIEDQIADIFTKALSREHFEKQDGTVIT
ncbi:PREDICTED: uncharacterized protein LOC109244083 [Nicotiana attenuata]|uniref:uncharacterized protein LOC109244083 n=1 Tax=Nicotiana attenuata TaxID=49451 RepID=UPI000905AB9B|nr:PREDICTED: uncharacterized protein LOC109244083 [Nicotiana attenuata]